MAQAPSRKVTANPEYVYFWYPHTATFDTAEITLKFKPPELQNSFDLGRNQTAVRTAGSKTLIYDRGTNFNTMMKLNFKYVTDGMRAQLIVFLEYVQWASRIIAYQDTYGDVYYVRCLNEKGITLVDQGLTMKAKQTTVPSIIQWDVSLDLLNLTDNPQELEDPEPPLSSALYLHIHDYDDPHNPEVSTLVNIADGSKVVEQFATVSWRTVIWTIEATKGARTASYMVIATHNRDGVTLATATDMVLETMTEIGTVTSLLLFDLHLTGSGVNQVMQLRCGTSEDGFTIIARRTKL